jgi:SAM-dependent methyltransferase
MNQNLDAWNQRLEYHLKSDFYGMGSFLAGRDSLPEYDRLLLGDVKGKSLLHMQCHFGQDSLSLARTGALVTGVDFSEPAIAKARELNLQLGLDADFVCCDVRETLQHVRTSFDIVYTSYGTIGWLPELESWAQVIAGALKPGGRLVFVEFHPVVWMFASDFTEIVYSYSNAGPILEEEKGTYADTDAPILTTTSTWNHGLAEVFTALTQAGLQVVTLDELDYSPYPVFPDSVQYQLGRYRMKRFDNKLPLVYSMQAIKPL